MDTYIRNHEDDFIGSLPAFHQMSRSAPEVLWFRLLQLLHRLRLCLPRHKYLPVFWSRFLLDLNIYLYALHLLFYVLSLALLPFPLVTKGDDLVSKFAQIFVRSTLIVLNYRFQTLAGCKKSDISTALFWFLLDAFS